METNEKTPEQLAAEQRERDKEQAMRELQQGDGAAAQQQRSSSPSAPRTGAATGFETTGAVTIPAPDPALQPDDPNMRPVLGIPAEDKVAVTTPENEIPRPAGAPPVAIVPAVPDPSAVPSNIRQQEEVFMKERQEFIERNAQHFPRAEGGNVYQGAITDVQFQQPGAPSQQWDNRPLNEAVPVVSEKTRAEMEAGRKRVQTRGEAEKNAESIRREREETAQIEREQRMGVSGETGEQLEAKRLEALRRAEIWGQGQTSRLIPPPPAAGVPSRA
jgi:hypothetical protein